MVNRKSRTAYFTQHGSPKKRLISEIIKSKVKNTNPKEIKYGKKKRKYNTDKYLEKNLSFFEKFQFEKIENEQLFYMSVSESLKLNDRFQFRNEEFSLISYPLQVVIISPKHGKVILSKDYLAEVVKLLRWGSGV